MKARCRTAAGMRDMAVLTNISTHGCCMQTRSLHLSIGVRVVVRPEGREGIVGTVRWIDGVLAGIAFDAPIYTPVVEHLRDENPVDGRPVRRARVRRMSA